MQKSLKSYFLKILFHGIAIHTSLIGVAGVALYWFLGFMGMSDKKRAYVIPLVVLLGLSKVAAHILNVYREARNTSERQNKMGPGKGSL